MKKIKGFAVAFVAVLAVTGAGASAASAAQFNSEASTTELAGSQVTQNLVAVGNLGEIKCSEVKYSGKLTAKASTTALIHPTYEGCSSYGQVVKIDTTGCSYALTASSAAAGNMSIVCDAGKEIVLSGPTLACTIKIKGQTPSNNTVNYTNQGSGLTRNILVDQQIGAQSKVGKGIAYTSSGGYCGASGDNGYIRGPFQINGYSDAAHLKQVGIWIQ